MVTMVATNATTTETFGVFAPRPLFRRAGRHVTSSHLTDSALSQQPIVYQRQLPFEFRSTDIDEVVASFRSTPEGERAWRRAERTREDDLRKAVHLKKVSKVRYYRLSRNLTQKKLADMTNTKQSDISRYERPSYRASRATLEKLAQALHVKPAELL